MGTRLSLARPINDYGKVQRLISSVIRNRRSFWLPLSSPLYLNIGCGSKIRNEFYNIDYDWVPGIDRCIDLESVGLEFPNGHVAGVFSEHCFEHLSFGTVSQIFRDLHRLLKPGGVFRLIVPDAELHARLYIAALDTGLNQVPFAEDLEREGVCTPVMSINACMREHGHRFIYDYDTLAKIATHAGFLKMAKRSFMDGADPTLLIDSPERVVESLYFEVAK